MLASLLPALIVLCGLATLGTSLYYLVGAARYNGRIAGYHYRYNPRSRQYRSRPLVTIMLSVHSDSAAVADSLRNLIRLPYKKLEILIIDQASTDDSRQVVRQFIAENPRKQLKLIARRKADDSTTIRKEIYKRHGHGELVLSLQAGSYLDDQALHRALMYVQADDEIMSVIPASLTADVSSLTSLWQRYLELARYYGMKAVPGNDTPEAIYRRQAFLSQTARRSMTGKRLYAADVTIWRPAHASFVEMCRHYFTELHQQLQSGFSAKKGRALTLRSVSQLSLIAATTVYQLIMPVLLAYFAYVSVRLHQPALLIVCVVGTIMWLGLAVCESSQLKFHQKVLHILGIPLVFGFFYLVAIIRLMAGLRALVPVKV